MLFLLPITLHVPIPITPIDQKINMSMIETAKLYSTKFTKYEAFKDNPRHLTHK